MIDHTLHTRVFSIRSIQINVNYCELITVSRRIITYFDDILKQITIINYYITYCMDSNIRRNCWKLFYEI